MIKRILSVVLCIVSIFILCSCGKKSQKNTEIDVANGEDKFIADTEAIEAELLDKTQFRVVVTDERLKPVEGANVKFGYGERWLARETDAEGTVIFEWNPGLYEVYVSEVPEQYVTESEHYPISSGRTVRITVLTAEEDSTAQVTEILELYRDMLRVGNILDFRMRDFDGNIMHSQDFFKNSQVTAILAWSMYDDNAINSLQEVELLRQEMSEQSFQVLGVCIDADTDENMRGMLQVVQDSEAPFLNVTTIGDPIRTLPSPQYPLLVLVDADGKILVDALFAASVDQYRAQVKRAFNLTDIDPIEQMRQEFIESGDEVIIVSTTKAPKEPSQSEENTSLPAEDVQQP